MPRPPKPSPDGSVPPRDTRASALSVADTLLHTQGYFGLSLEDVARGTGVKKSTLYYHFPGGKDELIVATAHRMLEVDEAGFTGAITSAPSAREQLLSVARWWFSERRNTERVLREALQHLPEQHQREVAAAFEERLYRPVRGVFDGGVTRGEFREHDTELSSWMFMGMLSELGGLAHLTSGERLAERVLDLLMRGVVPATE